MSIRFPQLVATAAALLTVLALVPAARAGYRLPPWAVHPSTGTSATTCHQYCDTVTQRGGGGGGLVTVHTVTASASRPGFQWLDAALGFGLAYGTVLLGAGVFAIRRRGRVVPVDTAG